MGKNNKCGGFSLIEILVALIIISLIVSALAPVITKRLARSSVTVGSFAQSSESNKCSAVTCPEGQYANDSDNCNCKACSVFFCKKCSNNECSDCADGYELIDGECVGGTSSCRESGGKPTQACCESVGAVYLPKAQTGLSTDLCMMKYNAFDDDDNKFEAAKHLIKLVNINTACTHTNCCWMANTGNTAGSGCTSAQNGDSLYSGCTRTLCNTNAAKIICDNWAPKNYAPGAWRLPSKTELNALKANIGIFSNNQGAAGLQLCSQNSLAGANVCPPFYGDSGKACAVSTGSSGRLDDCHPYRIWGISGSYLALSSSGASVGNEESANDRPKGVRCVTTNVALGGYPAEHIPDKSIGEPESQADCDKFNALFVPVKYNGNPNGRNICITKYNALDNSGPFNPNDSSIAKYGVKLTDVNTVCAQKSCCWNGVTSSTYTNNQGYGGSSRAVCQYPSAEKLCTNWNPTGSFRGAWRLPYKEELTSLAKYISAETQNSSFLNANLLHYSSGLQFCSTATALGVEVCKQKNGDGGAEACAVSSSESTTNDDCHPAKIWGNGNSYLEVSGYKATVGTEDIYERPKSVRCVSDAIKKTSFSDQTVDGLSEDDVKKYQQVCDKYNALFIPKKYLGTSKNICMTKYNAFDPNGPMYDYTDEQLAALIPAVKRVKIDTVCSSGNCCWYDGLTSTTYTSGHNGDSTYSGSSRAVCQKAAASSICSNWAPNGTIKGDWRQLSYAEMLSLATYLNFETKHSHFLSRYMGKHGLQLCDKSNSEGTDICSEKNGDGGAEACAISSSEAGKSDDCKPFEVWGTINAAFYSSGGLIKVVDSATASPKSVRCVTEAGVN